MLKENKPIEILFEDEFMIACKKPAGIPSQSDKSMDYDMVNRLKNELMVRDKKKVPPYIALVHRLDRPVAGIMVFAKTKEIAAQLGKQLQTKKFKKYYMAIVTKDLISQLGKGTISLVDYLIKDSRTNLSKVVTDMKGQAKKAQLYYEVLAVKKSNMLFLPAKEEPIYVGEHFNIENESPILSLIKVELVTGRHHQIRVQMSYHNNGLWGDTKYNMLFQGKKGWYNIALFACELQLEHPKTKRKMKFCCMPDDDIFSFFTTAI